MLVHVFHLTQETVLRYSSYKIVINQYNPEQTYTCVFGNNKLLLCFLYVNSLYENVVFVF